MKYFSATIQYLKKHLWAATIILIIPSVFACVFALPFNEVAFIAEFDYRPFGQTFKLIFDESWRNFWPVIVVTFLQIVCCSFLISVTDRHLRTGTLFLKSPMRMINYSIFPVTVSVILMCAVSVLFRLILLGMVSLVQAIGVTTGLPIAAATVIISIIAFLLFAAHVIATLPMIYWPPIMFLYGYRFRDAAAASFKMISGRSSKLFVGLFIPMLIGAIIQTIVAFCNLPVWAAAIIGFFVFLIVNGYTTVYAVVSFYELGDLERRDFKPYEKYMSITSPSERVAPQPVVAITESDKDLNNTDKPDKSDNASKSTPRVAAKTKNKANGSTASTGASGRGKNTKSAGRNVKSKSAKTENPHEAAGDDNTVIDGGGGEHVV